MIHCFVFISKYGHCENGKARAIDYINDGFPLGFMLLLYLSVTNTSCLMPIVEFVCRICCF